MNGFRRGIEKRPDPMPSARPLRKRAPARIVLGRAGNVGVIRPNDVGLNVVFGAKLVVFKRLKASARICRYRVSDHNMKFLWSPRSAPNNAQLAARQGEVLIKASLDHFGEARQRSA